MTEETAGLETYALLVDMRRFIGRRPCDCVETPEYVEYRRRTAAAHKDPVLRMLYEMLDEPFTGQEISVTCERCSLLERYDAIVEGRS